jgi:hypothetical protein
MMFSTARRRAIAWFMIGTLTAALVILAFYALLSMRVVLDNVRGAQNDARATSARIVDCTSPGRDCFERGQKQTAEAVASINRVAVLAAACADKPRRQTVEQIQACVIAELARQQEGTP